LNTYIGMYIVSTVGELFPHNEVRKIHAEIYDPVWLRENINLNGNDFDNAYMKKFGFMKIGRDRLYETMVFKAQKSTSKCCPYKADVSEEIDMEGYNDSGDAYQGHLKLCEKWSKVSDK
jgi:hypothetical protein